MELFDTHAHLLMKKQKKSVDVLIENAKKNNVTRINTIALGPEITELKESINLKNRYDNISIGAGLHPHNAKDENEDFYNFMIENIDEISIWGEIGLDYHYNFSSKTEQQKTFIHQLELAKNFNKRVMLHIRDAHEDTINILSDHKPVSGSVIHCYTSDTNTVKKYLDMGFYISFSGIVTFPNAVDLQKAAQYVPMNRLLVETDSPYLAPVPYRGKPCEPAHVLYTATKLAELKSIDIEDFAKITSKNSMNALSIFVTTKEGIL